MKGQHLLILISIPILTYAQDGAKDEGNYRPAGSFGIHFDQDFLASPINNEDRNYTQGTAFSYTRLRQERYNYLFLPLNGFYMLGDLVRAKLDDDSKFEITETPATLSFGVSAYTPRTLRSYTPAYGDRPFSSILFIETRRSRLIGRNYHSWSFTYGLMGTNVGFDFQSWAHRHLVQNRGIPIGWPTQVSQGGHFAWLIQNNMMMPLRRRKYDQLKENSIIRSRLNWDAAYGIQSAAGYYTYFGTQASLRVGWINLLNYMNTRTSFMQSGDKRRVKRKVDDPVIPLAADVYSRYWEHYFFGYAAPRLWARNNLIEGQPGVPSVYALDSKYLNTFVVEWELGLTTTRTTVVREINEDGDPTYYSDRSFQVSVSVKGRSPEFHYPPYTRSHYWGCININFPIDGRKTRLTRSI
jgi:hypothetical protein